VNDGKESGLYDGKNGHGFRRTVDGHTPFLTEQQQYGRDQCPRMSNTDPPYKVGDVPSPSNGFIQAPSSDTRSYGIGNTAQSPKEGGKGNSKNDPPLAIGFPSTGAATSTVTS
jgi:hypothetical protein